MAILRAELLKWKRSRVLPAILLAAAVSPAFNAALMWGASRVNTLVVIEWHKFLGQVAFFAHLIVYPLAYAFVGTYVVAREFQEGTASNLYALPVSRAGVTLAKVASAALVLLVAVVAAVPLALAAGLLVVDQPLTWRVVLETFVLYAETGLAQFLLLPVIMWLAAWTRHYIVPLAAAGFFVITNFATVLAGEDWFWIPTAVPALTAQASHLQQIAPYVPEWWLVLPPIFLVFLALTVVWTTRSDIV